MSGASTNISGPCPKASGPGLSEPKSFRLPEVKGLERIETAQRPKVVKGCHFLFVGQDPLAEKSTARRPSKSVKR